MSPCSGARPARAPLWKQWACTAGSAGGTTPLFTPRDGGGGVDGGCAEPLPCLQVGGVCSGPAPTDSGQVWLCSGGGLGEEVEQVEELGAPLRRTGE